MTSGGERGGEHALVCTVLTMERVVIVGAGTFGASLAWHLAGRGDEVVLVDQFEPGDPRATSGGETRLIRCSHGADADYSAMARRARTLWRELEAESGAELMTECGVSWFAHREDGWEVESERTLRTSGIPTVRQDVGEAAKQFPSFKGDDLTWVLHEPEAGVLRAQLAIQTLARQAAARGAAIVRGRAEPSGATVVVGDRVLEADRVVWSCGGWLAGLFDGLVQLRVTQQELFFFDGGPGWSSSPGWVDYDRAVYGTGDVDALGAKVAWDQEGPAARSGRGPARHDRRRWRRSRAGTPRTASRRSPRRASSARRRAATSSRPTRSSSPRRTPSAASVWIVGGGSGHGFKHGPAMAERIANAWHGGEPLPPRFALGKREKGTSLRSAGSNL